MNKKERKGKGMQGDSGALENTRRRGSTERRVKN